MPGRKGRRATKRVRSWVVLAQRYLETRGSTAHWATRAVVWKRCWSGELAREQEAARAYAAAHGFEVFTYPVEDVRDPLMKARHDVMVAP